MTTMLRTILALLAAFSCSFALAVPTPIRIHVVITNEAKAALNISTWEEADIDAAIQISNTNIALSNSLLAATVEHAGTTDGISQPTGDQGLILMNSIAISNDIVLLHRKQNNADVVIAITTDPTGGYVMTIPAASAYLAFATVPVVLLGNYGFQHEFGHLLGARHQTTGARDTGSNNQVYDSTNAYYQRWTAFMKDPNQSSPACSLTPIDSDDVSERAFCGHDIMAYEHTGDSEPTTACAPRVDLCNPDTAAYGGVDNSYYPARESFATGRSREWILPWYSRGNGSAMGYFTRVTLANPTPSVFGQYIESGNSTHNATDAVRGMKFNALKLATYRNVDMSKPWYKLIIPVARHWILR